MRKKFIIILLVLLSTFYISKNLYQLNLIQGKSMYPTYRNLQLTLIDKRAANYQHGDVIVFYCTSLDCIMVKRIIALPKETVLISDGDVFVNDIKSPHISGTVTDGGIASNELLLDEDQFFVLGDNYTQSKDSRSDDVGCIKRQNIIGLLIPNLPVSNQKGSP